MGPGWRYITYRTSAQKLKYERMVLYLKTLGSKNPLKAGLSPTFPLHSQHTSRHLSATLKRYRYIISIYTRIGTMSTAVSHPCSYLLIQTMSLLRCPCRLQPVYNESMPNGGNPLEMDVNAQFVGFEYNYTYLIFCGFIVWLIIPGIGLLYGGMARRKSALALLFQSLMVGAVTTFQWSECLSYRSS